MDRSTDGLSREALDAALLAAHDGGDLDALVRLYQLAAAQMEAAGEGDAACFYLTHAYVFALEAGSPEAVAIAERLRAHGRL